MEESKDIYILAIESSCDDTSAAVLKNNQVLSNVIANQEIHQKYGGVVPELASRAHQQNIVPVVQQALEQAKIDKKNLTAIAFTRGPGLMGSLLVGTSFATSMANALDIPLIDVNHMQAHILAHFIEESQEIRDKKKDKTLNQTNTQITNKPTFPFICLTISGGHTQIVKVSSYFDFEVLGETLDDAVGEAFDKSAKLLGLTYPGGPLIDKYAKKGNPKAYKFTKPKVGDLQYSFSGLKTAFLYFIRDEIKKDPDFIKKNLNDLCASIQFTIIEILIDKLKNAIKKTGIKEVAIAGGVSANSGLRNTLKQEAEENNWKLHIPDFKFTTDNAAMIAITAYYKFLNNDFAEQSISAEARLKEI